MGTADAPDTVIHAWVAELLTSPAWGVVQYADNAAVEAIFGIADLHRALAAGDMPSIAAWDSADRAARAVSATSAGAEVYAVRTAYQSTALVDTEHWATLDAVTGNALRAHAPATEGTGAARIGEVTRHAIRSWRRLTQLTAPESVACCVRSRGVETWRYGQLRARDVRRNTVPAAMLCRRITPWIRPAATMNSYMDALPDPVSDLPAPA